MPKYFMRVEAVNLAHFVDDTHDVSTIRGGSFLLLKAIEKISEEFQSRLQPISTAASQGLFFFDCEDNDEGRRETLCADVLNFLRKETGRHATFLTAIEKEIAGQFPLVLEKLETQIHRMQWRMPTVAVPDFELTEQECFLDGWRPGMEPYRVDPEVQEAKMSAATDFRRRNGRMIKHQLFHALLHDAKYKDNLCAKDLGELAHDQTKGVLNGKIALIHIDGNSFGAIRRDLCTSPKAREEFDKAIQAGFRYPFLEALLRRADNDLNFQTWDAEGNNALRLEVLLWGGDEMTMVVPAWKGLEVLQLFFNQAQNLAFTGVPLSHRAVIIFCHHNAPILQIRKLANDLLRQTKYDIRERVDDALKYDADFQGLSNIQKEEVRQRLSSHKYGDALHYLALESFDMLQGSLKNFLSRYYKGASFSSLLIHAGELATIREHLQTIHTNVARSKVFEVIEAVQEGNMNRVKTISQQIYSLLENDIANKTKNAVNAITKDDPARWYMVTDLWDYIPEWKAL